MFSRPARHAVAEAGRQFVAALLAARVQRLESSVSGMLRPLLVALMWSASLMVAVLAWLLLKANIGGPLLFVFVFSCLVLMWGAWRG